MNINAIRLELITRILLGVESDEELAAARQKAQQVREMPDEELLQIAGGGQSDE